MTQRTIFEGGEFLVADIRPEDVFTPEEMTKAHKLILASVQDFVKREIEPNLDQIEEKSETMTRSLLKITGEIGLNGTDIPEAYGGEGMDKICTCLVSDVIGGTASFAVSHSAHTGIGMLPIVYFGTHKQKQRYLPRLATGEWIAAYCLTEPNAGSDALNSQTSATLSADGKYYILNGEKIYITNGAWADVFIVYAKVDGARFTGFIVERSFPGIFSGVEEKKMGINGSSTTAVVFKNCKVPVENVLFEIGKGHKIAFNILNIGRYKLGAGVTGGCKITIAEASKYANLRQQFGRKIGSFGMIKNKLADMSIRTYMAEAIIYRLAAMLDDRCRPKDTGSETSATENANMLEAYAVECSIAKVYCSECLDFCVDELVQIFGGNGYVAEYPAERMYRDARINRIFDGTNEINRLLIPGTILKRALSGRLSLFDKMQRLDDENYLYSSDPVMRNDAALGMQKHMLAACKKILLISTEAAVNTFLDNLAEEQEVLALMADIIMEIFAAESGLLRAEKFAAAKGEKKAAHHIAAVIIYMNDMMPRLAHWAKQILAASLTGVDLSARLAAADRLSAYDPINTIELRRLVAEKALKGKKYPF